LATGCGRIGGTSPEALYGEANRAQRRGDLVPALEQTDHGIRLCGKLPSSDCLLQFQLLKAEILLSQNRAEEATPLLETAATTIPKFPSLKGRWLSNLAELRRQADQEDAFRSLLAQARDLASRDGDSALLSWIEQRRGVFGSDFTESDAALRHALALARKLGDEYLISGALNGLGYIRLIRSRYDDAISYFEEADQAAQKIPSKVRHEKCLGNLGWCYFRLGQWQRALELFSTAEPLAAEAGVMDDDHRWLANMGSVYYTQVEYDKAIPYYLRASDIARRVRNRRYAATYLNNIARVYIDQSKWDEAEKYSRQAMETLQGVADAGGVEAYSRLNSGFIAAARRQTAKAEAEFRGALDLAEREEEPNVLWEAHSGLAALDRSQNNPAETGKEYAAAMGVLDREWLALSRDQSKITFRGYQAGVYQQYVDFLSERGQKEKALEVAESSRARLMGQKLESGSFVLPRFRADQAVRLARQTGTVLLSYWLAPQRSYVWAVTAKGVSQFVLPGEDKINVLVERHQRAIQELQDPLVESSAAASELYRMLVGPVESLVHSAGTVIIVPDGRLHELNFETLVVDGPKPHYWIEDATLALTPSFAVLQLRKSVPAREPRLLIFGNPLPAVPEFPPLPHLKAEIRDIAAGFPEGRRAVYTGEQAYAEHFRETDPHAFTAIHFAAHAAANDESPLNSAIILSPHNGKYKLYAREVADLRLEPDLVTISACRSAGSRAYSGEGLVGFAWAFLEAGAHNVVAGIWNVDDAAAPVIMEELYKQWREGSSPAVALRRAKLKLMQTGGAFRKPYYWGAFEVFTR
jgi:CHAT domain-containing protein/tetratricopeptide (TPR) repeat protein